MKTPIADFIENYIGNDISRLHMPGHKGCGTLGVEKLDITEIQGAGNLYEYEGIIAESEKNASALFESGHTFYSAGGSSQSIRAMLYLAVQNYSGYGSPVILAARNVHKAFVYAAAMLDFEVQWLYPKGDMRSLCSCEITAESLENALKALGRKAAAVYITSPDYLGGQADIAALAEVCHRYGTLLLVDNAHGAYLKFLTPSQHPLDLGADMCCDSAHKTLPVLTGGGYLHLSKRLHPVYAQNAKTAMEMFGSTSPSYLIMTSLDKCNAYIADGYDRKLAEAIKLCEGVKEQLKHNGWKLENTDPLRITVCAPDGLTGSDLANKLREHKAECEFADADFLVLMVTPETRAEDYDRVLKALGENALPYAEKKPLEGLLRERKMTVRQAMMAKREKIAAESALGRICATAGVGCPPAIPVVIPGEVIDEGAVKLLEHYGIDFIEAVKTDRRADNAGAILESAFIRPDVFMERFEFDGRKYALIEKPEFFCVTELTAVCLEDMVDSEQCVPLYTAHYVPRDDIYCWDPVPAELFCDWKNPVSVTKTDKKLNTATYERV
ncbi:MAG: PLP-dependent transferase [Oscillospiraceae bacterium]|nr:PLP-dependent transferase [Oscillospiraceae bacterium]